MKYIPTLFSTQMVEAIIDDIKSQTRRLNGLDIVNGMKGIGPSPNRFKFLRFEYQFDHKSSREELHAVFTFIEDDKEFHKFSIKCPYGQCGDILWVRETLRQNGELGLQYVADNEWIDEDIIPEVPFKNGSYRNYAFCNVPNIHMPMWACRIFLKVKSIGVERINDISEDDAIEEGVYYLKFGIYKNYYPENDCGDGFLSPKDSFCSLWSSINGVESWKANPWVWVIEFERIEKPLNWPL